MDRIWKSHGGALMRWYLDTEFDENAATSIIQLISIALVSDAGEYYAHLSGYDPESCNDWVRKNVLPQVECIPKKNRGLVAHEIRALLGAEPEIWGYYADYDWVMLCKLYGTMMELPAGWPRFCLDIRQQMHEQGVSKDLLPPQVDRHDAFQDARWIKQAKERLDEMARAAHLRERDRWLA